MARALRAVSVAIVLAASGCGGGGGSGGGDGSGGGSVVATGLVPEAPPPGAVLYADATVLRPLVSGGTWTYRGYQQSVDATTGSPLGAGRPYDNVVTQAGSGASVLTESASNLDGSGVSVQAVAHGAGSVTATGDLALPDGSTRRLAATELRSPVRAGDQYTVLDTRLVDAGVDVDGDGKNDGADLVIYTRVVGNETIDLPSRPQLSALRTTTTLAVRFRLSTTQQFSPAVSARIDIWYAPGIGPVRRVGEGPAASPSLRDRTTEDLVTWDGLTTGLGYLPGRVLRRSDGTAVNTALSVASFDDHALLLSQASDVPALGISLSRIDGRGTVLGSLDHPGINSGRVQAVRVGTTLRVVEETDAGILMHTFDAAGQRLGNGPVPLVAGVSYGFQSGQPFALAAAGDTLWLLRFPYTSSSQTTWELQLQPFDASGQALAPPTVVGTASPGAVVDVRSSSWQERGVFTWVERRNGGDVMRSVAVPGNPALPPTVRDLNAPAIETLLPIPVATATGTAILWPGGLGNGEDRIGGVTLDSAGEPLRSNAGTVLSERLSLPWLAQPRQLAVSGGDAAFVFAVDVSASPATQLLWQMQPGSGPLVTDNRAVLLASGIPTVATLMAPLSNSVLLFEVGSGSNTVTSAWRRP